MPLRGSAAYYSDVNWFVRAVRAVPVIAGAALLGGLIGGFAVFAVDSALNWEPQGRTETRTDNQAIAQTPAQASAQTNGQQNALEQHATKPVRIVGGAIPDPSAGMSAPPPAAQPERKPTPAQPQISSQLLTPKPLGPAAQLQPQSATTAASSVAQPQNETANQTNQISVPAQNASRQQTERWPDALSRAHQNTANAPTPAPQAAPLPAAPVAGASTETERNDADSNRAATADNQNRSGSPRHSRHSRQTMFNPNNGRAGNDIDSAGAPSSRRQAARSYDRLYDSTGNQTQRSYGSRREPFYGAPRAADQDDTGYGADTRRSGRDGGYRNRSRVITREQPSDQTLETRQQRPEPFWGGGFFGRGNGYRDDD